MKPTEIFRDISPEANAGIFRHLQDNDKAAYKACVNLLAGRRKLRTVLIERRQRNDQYEWLRNELTRRSNEDAAAEVIQAWLLGAHQALIIQFLDLLKIPHDGRGLLETLPAEPPKAEIEAAINELFAKHEATAVAVYLNVFVEMDIAQWPVLKQLVQEDSRLCLAPQTTPA